MRRYVLFDLDGTLLNSMPYHAKAWIETLKRYGIEFDEKEVYLHEGALEFSVVKSIFNSKGVRLTEDLFRELFEEQKRIFREKYADMVKPYDGVDELLCSLKEKGKKLALVTSSHADVLREACQDDFLSYFDVVLTGDATTKRKPHPEPYLKALSLLGGSREDAVAVENSPAGVKSAKGAGLFCIAITTTLEPCYLSPPADLVVESHGVLKKVLLNGKA